jgi:hypothetical protein
MLIKENEPFGPCARRKISDLGRVRALRRAEPELDVTGCEYYYTTRTREVCTVGS